MNNTKWREIFEAFYYGIECAEDEALCRLPVHWATKSLDGYIYNDSTWTHFGCGTDDNKDIEWLRIDLTAENRAIVLDIFRKIHVPGEVLEDCVFVYGYRTDVDYIK